MCNIIDTIEHGYGFPVNSVLAAVQDYNEIAREGAYQYNYGNVLRNILGIDCQELENDEHARIQVGYVIQLAVTAHIAGEKIDPTATYVEATKLALDLIETMPWVFAVKEKEVKLDASGKPKAKKGSKGTRSYELYCELVGEGATRKEIIEAFQSEEQMEMTPHTKSGATTYFYNMKKKFEADSK
ncbi:hypothetical protein LCGC14_2087030 [marine sediment metagenome]|uniref:Uncharacterized protein n=1 Tax=marine sediment metagenome TaxID=412755 RepID=A0A0F9HAW0_9ZZZZ